MFDGMRSAVSASASSGVCLYLKVSRVPGTGAAAPFVGFDAAAAGAAFLTAGAEEALGPAEAAAGFFPYMLNNVF